MIFNVSIKALVNVLDKSGWSPEEIAENLDSFGKHIMSFVLVEAAGNKELYDKLIIANEIIEKNLIEEYKQAEKDNNFKL